MTGPRPRERRPGPEISRLEGLTPRPVVQEATTVAQANAEKAFVAVGDHLFGNDQCRRAAADTQLYRIFVAARRG